METKEIILKKLRELSLMPKTNFIFLFGSVHTGKATPLSDIDICISLSLPPKERLRARMKLLGKLPEKYDIQIFEDLPLYVQKEVLGGELLYAKNKKEVIEVALQIIQAYEDFEPIYQEYISRGTAA